jgi:hypothetical protein
MSPRPWRRRRGEPAGGPNNRRIGSISVGPRPSNSTTDPRVPTLGSVCLWGCADWLSPGSPGRVAHCGPRTTTAAAMVHFRKRRGYIVLQFRMGAAAPGASPRAVRHGLCASQLASPEARSEPRVRCHTERDVMAT